MSDPTERLYVDVFGDSVVMTEAVYRVILSKHPEVSDFIDRVGEALRSPDEVRRSSTDQRVALYYLFKQDVFNGKWIVVVVKNADRKFISTVYATNKIKAGDVIWTR